PRSRGFRAGSSPFIQAGSFRHESDKAMEFPDRIMRSTNLSKSMILKSEAGDRRPNFRKPHPSWRDPVVPDPATH
ncbi:MAG: hypothetical protein ACREDU_11165, partial [Methylocella sp.]